MKILDDLERLADGVTLIPNHDGYAADIHGNIWSYKHNWRGYGVRQLTAFPDVYGYPTVKLSINGKTIKRKVHRLVCLAFHGNPSSDQLEVRHIDGTRTNNRVNNLTWGTRSENALDRQRHGTCKSAVNGRTSAKRSLFCKRGHKFDRIGEPNKRSYCSKCERTRKKNAHTKKTN